MKVLVACEESQRVCIAFREKGHENYPNAMTVGTYHQLRKEINAIATEMRQEVEK